MEPDELAEVDLEEMREWKRRNRQERLELLDQYAEWLRANGVLKSGDSSSLKRGAKKRKVKSRSGD